MLGKVESDCSTERIKTSNLKVKIWKQRNTLYCAVFFYYFLNQKCDSHILLLSFQIFFSKKYEKPAKPFLDIHPLLLPLLLWIQRLSCTGKSDQET